MMAKDFATVNHSRSKTMAVRYRDESFYRRNKQRIGKLAWIVECSLLVICFINALPQ